jgi:hypothetical protein
VLVEIVLRARLAERGEQLEGLYEGQKTRKEGRPTAKRMLRAVAGLEMTLSVIQAGEQRWWYLPPLPTLLVRVLDLLGLAPSLYTSLATPGSRPPSPSSAPSIPVPSG